jgi:hypothetical protein
MTDRSLTLWQGLSGRERDLLTAKPTLPAVILLAYGVYKFFDLGTAVEHSLYTYVVTAGAAASIVCIFLYAVAAARPATRSIGAMLVGLSGFVPYFFSIYVMAVLGGYGIWLSINPLSVFGIIAGFIWIGLGYHMLRKFWIITELTVRRTPAGAD